MEAMIEVITNYEHELIFGAGFVLGVGIGFIITGLMK